MGSSSYSAATGMVSLLSIKHDKITQQLSKCLVDSEFLWSYSIPCVKELTESKEMVVLSFDDSIEEKQYTDSIELVCWHYNPVFRRWVKKGNFLTGLVETCGMRLPFAVEPEKKDLWVTDKKTDKQKRKSSKTKNELFREMTGDCAYNYRFDFVLAESKFSSAENMQAIKDELNINFIFSLKSNRKDSLSKVKKQSKKYIHIELMQPGQTVKVWLEELDFPLLLVKQVFKNADGTSGEFYLAYTDLNLSYEQITTVYKKRWSVEEYHQSIKSNTGFVQSHIKNIKTQTNHFVLSIVVYLKLERLKQRTGTNHFAMKNKIYLVAQQAAYLQLKKLSTLKAA
jgi:hypothetical protein